MLPTPCDTFCDVDARLAVLTFLDFSAHEGSNLSFIVYSAIDLMSRAGSTQTSSAARCFLRQRLPVAQQGLSAQTISHGQQLERGYVQVPLPSELPALYGERWIGGRDEIVLSTLMFGSSMDVVNIQVSERGWTYALRLSAHDSISHIIKYEHGVPPTITLHHATGTQLGTSR